MNYTLIDYALMFFSVFLSVFLLGLQSKNVQNSRYVAAVITSFGISVGQFLFTKYASSGEPLAFFACAAGGCVGIACSIWFYDNVLKRKKNAA